MDLNSDKFRFLLPIDTNCTITKLLLLAKIRGARSMDLTRLLHVGFAPRKIIERMEFELVYVAVSTPSTSKLEFSVSSCCR
jgi:hypothetical protein